MSLFFLGEFVWAWISIIKGIQHRPEPITGVFALVLAASFASVAWKSVFWADRIVGGAIAGIGALIAVSALHFSPSNDGSARCGSRSSVHYRRLGQLNGSVHGIQVSK